jgi:hypothetical protein
MSYSNYFKAIYPTAHTHVDGEHPNNPNDLKNVTNDERYVDDQTNLISSQQKNRTGKLPHGSNISSYNSTIQKLRYGIDDKNNQYTSDEQYSNDKLAPDELTDDYNSFDPYIDYLNRKGSIKENVTKKLTTSTYLIDSSARTTVPQIITAGEYNLATDPLMFDTIDVSIGVSTTTQNILSINYPDHACSVNDRISLSGLMSTEVSINNVYTNINGNTNYAIAFEQGSTSVAFICNYDTVVNDSEGNPTSTTDTSMSFDPNFKIGTGISETDLKSYDTSDMFVNISGFVISHLGLPFYGNIPINFLNSRHRIYLSNPAFEIINGVNVYGSNTAINVPNSSGNITKVTGFYIQLPEKFTGVESTNVMNILLKFNYVGGIPINVINAQFPVDDEHTTGYHKVYSITKNTINVLLSKETHYADKTSSGLSNVQLSFGGSNMYISKIVDVYEGNNDPNK